MNSRAKDRVATLRALLSLSGDRLLYSDIPAPPFDPVRDAAMAQYIQTHYGRDHGDELAVHGNDMMYWLGRIEQLLLEDLESYCNESERLALQRVALGYLPRLTTNAFAERLPENELGEYVIGVNAGLLWVSSMLCEALLLAESDRTVEACEAYGLALTFYYASTQAEMFKAMSASSLGNDDEMSVQSGAVGSVILRFVGLHELGHVVLGHTERAGMHLLPETGAVHYDLSPSLGVGGVHAMEFAADRFAIEHMLACTGSAVQMWNNTLFISAFFRLLEHVEILRGKSICPFHPPPESRILALENRVRDTIGPPPNDAPRWAADTLLMWR